MSAMSTFVNAAGSPIKKKDAYDRAAVTSHPGQDNSYVSPRPPPLMGPRLSGPRRSGPRLSGPRLSTPSPQPTSTTLSAARLPPVSAHMDKKTQIATYMASKLGVGYIRSEGTSLNGDLGPPPLGYDTVAVRPAIVKKVTLPRIDSAHGLPRPCGGDPHHDEKLKLAKMEQDVCFNDSTAVKNSFSPFKSKELDSGIISLETPSCVFSPLPSPTFSTISSPATFSSICNTPAGSITSGGSSPSGFSPPAAVAGTYLAVAHNAVALAQMRRSFEKSQEHNPAEAAVFVGNLPAFLTDLQLSYELIASFKLFGHLDVQVARHYTAQAVKPTAILQFTHPVAATKAISNSRGWSIGGRKLRVDRSSAPRYITVWHNGATHFSSVDGFQWSSIMDSAVKQAKQDFACFGPFDEFECVISWWTYVGKPFNDGIRIKFTNYGQFIAAKKAIRSGALPYTEKKVYRSTQNP